MQTQTRNLEPQAQQGALARAGAALAGAADAPWALPAVLALGLLLRLGALALLWGRPLVSDALSYHMVALEILATGRYGLYWPPGLPFALAAVYAVAGPHEVAARVAMLVVSMATLAMTFLLGRELASRRVGVLATLLLAVYPTFVHLAVEPLTQYPTALCLAAAAYLLLRAEGGAGRARLARLALAGLALGAMALVRPSSLALAGAAVLLVLWRSRRLLPPLALAGAAALPVALWVAYASSFAGALVPINYANSYNVFVGNNPYTPLYKTWLFGSHTDAAAGVPPAYSALAGEIAALPLAERDARYRAEALAHIVARPDLFVVRTLSRVRSFFAFDTFSTATMVASYAASRPAALLFLALDAAAYVTIAAGALACLLGVRPALRPGGAALLAGAALLYAAPYFLSFAHPVYHFPVMPLLAALAAAALDRLLAPAAGAPALPGRRARLALVGAWTALLLVQVEWVIVMAERF